MKSPNFNVLSIFASSVMLATVVAGTASAQTTYSQDPATPELLRSTAYDDVQVKLAVGPANSTYYAYFSNPGYDIMLDRLDANGHSMWKSALVVEDRTLSSTVDYGVASDAAGNAYISYNGYAADGTTPTQKVASVSATGAIRWTSVVYSAAGASLGNGRVAVASDGAVWGACSVGFDSAVQRFDSATGVATFATPVYVNEAGAKQMCSGFQASLDGSVILTTIRYTTTYTPKILRAHRISVDGTRPWAAAGVPLFTSTAGGVQTGNFPDFLPDGSGGGYIYWYGLSTPINCRCQHLSPGGVTLWGTDGVAVSTALVGDFGGTASSIARTNPVLTVGSDGRVYEFYRAYSGAIAGIVWYGIGAQCFDTDGNPMWGAGEGVMIDPYQPSSAGVIYDKTPGAALNFGGAPGVSFTISHSAIALDARAAAMNPDGSIAWNNLLATDAGSKYRFASSTAVDGGANIAWQGGVNAGGSDLFCAHISGTGVLGPPMAACVADLNGDHNVDGSDLAGVLGQWGSTGVADLNHDGTVDGQDLATLLGGWGPCQ